MSAISTVSTGTVISLRPLSRTLLRSTCVLSNSKPLFHLRSPVKPGAPDGGTNVCDAKGEPCVIDESSAAPGRPSDTVAARE